MKISRTGGSAPLKPGAGLPVVPRQVKTDAVPSPVKRRAGAAVPSVQRPSRASGAPVAGVIAANKRRISAQKPTPIDTPRPVKPKTSTASTDPWKAGW